MKAIIKPYLNRCFVRTIAACESISQPAQLDSGTRTKTTRESRNVNVLLMNCRGITDNISNLFQCAEENGSDWMNRSKLNGSSGFCLRFTALGAAGVPKRKIHFSLTFSSKRVVIDEITAARSPQKCHLRSVRQTVSNPFTMSGRHIVKHQHTNSSVYAG